jgi:hypothetical protein
MAEVKTFLVYHIWVLLTFLFRKKHCVCVWRQRIYLKAAEDKVFDFVLPALSIY